MYKGYSVKATLEIGPGRQTGEAARRICYHQRMAEEQGSAFRLRAEFADRSWEALLSNLLCPPVLWAALALPVSYRDAVAGQQPLLWAAAYICFVCLLPTLYVGVNVLRGSITDLHLRERRQRHRPYLVSILCALFAWLALGLLGGTEIIRALALFSAANMAAMAAITVFWQISMHTMSASSALVALAIFFLAAGGPALCAAAGPDLRRAPPPRPP